MSCEIRDSNPESRAGPLPGQRAGAPAQFQHRAGRDSGSEVLRHGGEDFAAEALADRQVGGETAGIAVVVAGHGPGTGAAGLPAAA